MLTMSNKRLGKRKAPNQVTNYSIPLTKQRRVENRLTSMPQTAQHTSRYVSLPGNKYESQAFRNHMPIPIAHPSSSGDVFSRLGSLSGPEPFHYHGEAAYYDHAVVNERNQSNYVPSYMPAHAAPHSHHPQIKQRRSAESNRPPARKKSKTVQDLALGDEQYLHDLVNTPKTEKIVSLLALREQELKRLLGSKEATSGSITLSLLAKLFSRLSTLLTPSASSSASQQTSTYIANTEKKLKEVLQHLMHSDTFGGFYLSLGNFLCQMPTEGSTSKRKEMLPILKDTVAMCNVLLDVYPGQASRDLSIVDICVGTATQLADQQIIFKEVSEKTKNLLEKRNSIRTKSYEMNCESYSQNFSEILPPPEELFQDVLSLEKNVISGAFPDASTYLTTHFQLLLQDFLNPLRQALRDVCEGEDDDERQNVMVYQDVRFDKGRRFTFSGSGQAYKISFKTPRKIKWNRSKRLQYGSLVCLSKDNFQTVLYATIFEKNVEDLNKGITTIQLQNCSPDAEIQLSPATKYSMIQSPGYYEAYAPVLKRLNKIEPKELPFKSYIIDLNADVNSPLYLRGHSPTFDLRDIICKCNKSECEHKNVQILDEENWKALKTPLLDDSQKKALHMALTKEMALIQGPPGTGKTYVGLKLIQCLIRNKRYWKNAGFLLKNNCPIVVICYTNHALDQFLEGILQLKLDIQVRRIGSRTKSETIAKLNLQAFVHQYCREHRIFNPIKSWTSKQKLVEAMNEFITGQFCKENSQLYCYFLSSYVIEEIEGLCRLSLGSVYDAQKQHIFGLESRCGHFASWLDPMLKRSIEKFYDDQNANKHDDLFKAENDDRKEMSHSHTYLREVHDLFQALREEKIKEFVEYFGKIEPLTEKRASEFLDGDEKADNYVRLQLFKYCLKQLYLKQKSSLKGHAEVQEKYDEDIRHVKLRCLERADVVGLTTTAAARDNLLISQLQSKILIVEEAAEVLEPQLVASLTKSTQHLILIGDHKQLRPKTNDHIIGRQYHLEISMFERLVSNSFPHATLQVQHRMRPEISKIVCEHIYNGKLEDHDSTSKYDDVRGMKYNMFFVNHSQPEDPNPDLKSPSNKHEAEFLAAFCYYLLQQGYRPNQITVITPYVGQMFELRNTFRENRDGISDVYVTPIDAYQGEENDIILLSLVRSIRPGFVKEEDRICVALSRAKQGLYCIGNFDLFSRTSKLWEKIIKDVRLTGRLSDGLPLKCAKHSNETIVARAADFSNVPEGGCQEFCRERLPCHHVCMRKCHPRDDVHKLPCREPCPKRCSGDIPHRCKLLCFQKCDNCKEEVEKVITKCGHVQPVPCCVQQEDFVCQEECKKTLKCGHVCKNKCGEECTNNCKILVEKELACGHIAKVDCCLDPVEAAKQCKHPCEDTLACEHKCSGTCGRCYQSRLHVACNEKKCDRILMCGHKCSGSCAKYCPPCSKLCMYECQHGWCGHKCSTVCHPCTHKCEWKCKHYQCTKNCGEMCDRPRCNEKCPKPLTCSHPCIGLCGEPCPSICRQCLSQEEFESEIPILFGDEHDEDVQYVLLVGCGHVLESKSLDQWMDQVSEEEEIKWKSCPRCKAPILKTARYSNITKQIMQDMNRIKERERSLPNHQRKEMTEKFYDMPLQTLGYQKIISHKSLSRWKEHVPLLSDSAFYKLYLLSCTGLDMLEVRYELKSLLGEIEASETARLNSKTLQLSMTLLLSQSKSLLGWIERNQKRVETLTDQMAIDLKAERRRILLLEAMYKLMLNFQMCKTQIDDIDQQVFTKIGQLETSGKKIDKITDDFIFTQMMRQLQAMPNKYRTPLTIEERTMIIKAIGAKPGSWYKCPQGHYYQIGQCGGATVTSKCPECGSLIGGRSHRLLETNQHAGEFDGSGHAAWSEGANLRNFDLGNLL